MRHIAVASGFFIAVALGFLVVVRMPPKKKRTREILHNTMGGVSQRSLTDIINRLLADDIGTISRRSIYSINQESLEALLHSVEVSTIDGGVFAGSSSTLRNFSNI